MDKQFLPFKAKCPVDFKEKMINYWMIDEKLNREDALLNYADNEFTELSNRISGNVCSFIPDIGYADDSINGTICLEEIDDCFVIPVSILEVVK